MSTTDEEHHSSSSHPQGIRKAIDLDDEEEQVVVENPLNLSKMKNKKKKLVAIKKKKTPPAHSPDDDDDDAPPPPPLQLILGLKAPKADPNHLLVSAAPVIPTKKRSASATSSAPPAKKVKKNTLNVGASDDDELPHPVTSTKKKKQSTSSTKIHKNTLDVGPHGYGILVHYSAAATSTKKSKNTLDLADDDQPATVPPGTVILLPYTTPSEKDVNQDNASREKTQLGAQVTANVVAHSSPVNTCGHNTPDIDELTALNHVLAPAITNSPNTTQPLKSISIEQKQNGVTPPPASDTDVTNYSDDILDAIVDKAFDSDPPSHDMEEDSDHVDIGGFKVRQEFTDIAREILDKHGDIFAKASVTGYLRSQVFITVCTISDKLARFTISKLSLAQLKAMRQNVEELLKLDVNVTWLAKSLDELCGMKDMRSQLHHQMQVRKQKKKIIVDLEEEREVQVKLVQQANQNVDNIDMKIKTVTEEIDSVYHTVMSQVIWMQQCKDKPAKDVVGF